MPQEWYDDCSRNSIQSKATRSKSKNGTDIFAANEISKHLPSFDPVIYHSLAGRNVKISLGGYLRV
jgi:hypothetical protein